MTEDDDIFTYLKEVAEEHIMIKGICQRCGAELPEYPQYFEDWRGKVQVKVCPKCGYRYETVTNPRDGKWVRK